MKRAPVVGERELKSGDHLTVGPLQFEVHVGHGLAGKKRPPVVDVKEATARAAHDAAQDPFDVTQWLDPSAADADTQSAPTADMQTASLSDTDAINLSTTQTVVPETPGDETHKGTAPKKSIGKLPVSKSKDSQDAAAAMLNKLRKRR